MAQSNRATDLYALGVLLNTMITGVHPAVDIPRGPIRHIVQKATDTQISKRYKSAAAMARALRSLCTVIKSRSARLNVGHSLLLSKIVTPGTISA